MDDHPLYGKRKKKKETSANPLFVEWLTEWKEEAAEKGWKSQYTYGKALNALKKFPLPMSSGKDCKILENFGDKTCKMLDDKLAQHVATYGTTAPVNTTNTVTDTSPRTTGKMAASSHTTVGVHKRQNSQDHRAVGGRQVGQVDVGGPRVQRAHEISDSSDEEVEQPARKRQRSGRKSGDREYIPAYRSGPYALLLTLYRDMQSPDSRGFMTKAELTRAAQPLADKSFSIPDPGCRYTSWSSMGTLIKKGLVIKESSPAKYSITDAGCELAHKLEAVKGDDVDRGGDLPFRIHDPQAPAARASPVTSPQPRPAARLPDLPASPRLPQLPDLDDNGNIDLVDFGSSTTPRLQYWYVTDDGDEVLEKDRAMVTIDDEISIGFLVKCNYSELLKSGLRYKLDTSRPLGDDYVHVYLHNDDAADKATPPVTTVPLRKNAGQGQNTEDKTQNKKKKPEGANSSKAKKPSKASKLEGPQLLPLIQSLETAETNPIQSDSYSQSSVIQSVPVVIDSEESSLDSLPGVEFKSRLLQKLSDNKGRELCPVSNRPFHELKSSQSSVGSTNATINYVPSFKGKTDNQSNKDLNSNYANTVPVRHSQETDSQESSQNSVQSLSSVSSLASIQSLPKPDFVLRPGEFDVILCVDNAEYYGASKGSSKTLLPDLLKNGINCELRKLHVGDLLWVAKEKVKPLPGQLEKPQGRELVLDYIIERKRMDDLVSSCIDGRFKEQKFRLKKCGLRYPMYLVEDYGSMQHFSLPEKTIKQAITNTQVIDGFQVKRTKDSKETVAFLTVMTRYLQSSFRDKILYASSLEDLKEFSGTFNINDSEQRLATFGEFNQGSVKTKALTVQEMFGKQLIQLHGMSAEKARAIIDRYPTPSHLFKAYEMCSTEVSKESLLSSIKCGKAARSLGAVQSKQIYQLYCTRSALT